MKISKLALLVLLLANSAFLFAQNKKSIYFDSGKSDIKMESEATLQTLVNDILTFSDVDLRIEAFTDDKGTETFNRQLAQQRADAVRSFLANRQISLQKLDIRSIGELAVDEKESDIEESRRKNRRVDIYFTPISIGNISDLSTRITSNSTVSKEFNANEATILRGSNGVKVEVPSDAFMFANGQKPQGTVKLTLKEAIKTTDWIFNNLSTVSSDGQIMSSGGMFNLEASANGQPLQLVGGKKIKISVPSATKANPEMELFYGTNHNPAAPQPVAWRDNKLDWEDANLGRTENTYFLTSLKDRFRKCFVENKVERPELPTFDERILTIAKGLKPQTPYLEEPIAPKVRSFDNTPLPTKARAQRKEIKKREAAIAKSEASFEKRKKLYETNLAEYKQAWENYRTDSAEYVFAQQYLAEAKAKIDKYENSLVKFRVIEDHNNAVYRLMFNLKYRKYGNLKESMSTTLAKSQSESLWGNEHYNMIRKSVGLRTYDTAYNFLSQITNKDKTMLAGYYDDLYKTLNISNLETVNAEIQKEYNAWIESKVSLSVNEVNEYVGEVSKMGWVNCDVFYKYDAASARPVALKESEDARTFLICKKINAMLPMNRSKDKTAYGFGKVPAGLDIVVVSIKIKDGFPLLSISKLDKLPTEALIPEYKKVSVPQLREALAAL